MYIGPKLNPRKPSNVFWFPISNNHFIDLYSTVQYSTSFHLSFHFLGHLCLPNQALLSLLSCPREIHPPDTVVFKLSSSWLRVCINQAQRTRDTPLSHIYLDLWPKTCILRILLGKLDQEAGVSTRISASCLYYYNHQHIFNFSSSPLTYFYFRFISSPLVPIPRTLLPISRRLVSLDSPYALQLSNRDNERCCPLCDRIADCLGRFRSGCAMGHWEESKPYT